MANDIRSYLKRGYIPLALSKEASIAWQGEYVHDLWMWNRQFMASFDGKKKIQAVKVNDMKEAALRYWRDGWVPLRPIDDEFLKKMEDALREHKGLKLMGIKFPDSRFLQLPDEIPGEFSG